MPPTTEGAYEDAMDDIGAAALLLTACVAVPVEPYSYSPPYCEGCWFGETGGDALSMTEQLGYAVSSLIFLGFFCIALVAQVASKRYHPFVYWVVVVATTTVGTTMSDYLDRTLGLGYVKSSIMLFCGVMV